MQKTLSRCNESTIVYEPTKYTNRAGNNISHLMFQQIQSSILLETKVVLDQIAYEYEARGVKSLKI